MPTSSHKRTGLPLEVEYITIHSTGNEKSTAKNEREYLTNTINTSSTGFHIVVDDKEIIECVPLGEVAWHAGDGYLGTGNRKSIGIEMCESGDRMKVISNTVTLAAQLLKKYNLSIDKLKRHHDWSGKNCPRILSANNWEGWTAFKLMVEREM